MPLPRVGATYRVEAGPMKPALDEVEVAILGRERVEGSDYTWFQFAARSRGELLYAVKLLVDGLEFLSWRWAPEPKVARYQFLQPGHTPLEFVDGRTGGAYLPGLNLFQMLVPHATARDGLDERFFAEGEYLERKLTRLRVTDQPVDLIPSPRRLFLRPDTLVGTSRLFRDAAGKRLYEPGKPGPEGRPDYEYRRYTPEEYARMADETGTTLFVVDGELLPAVLERPVFFTGALGPEHYPALLYRSNYQPTMFMDEPGIITIGGYLYRDAPNLYAAAQRFVGVCTDHLDREQRGLGDRLRGQGFLIGGYPFLRETRLPVWETVTGSAWYEYEAGIAGHIAEGRYQPEAFASLVKQTLGVEFPATPEAVLRFHIAWYRGAAEHFGRPWGLAIYGQMADSVRPLVFPLSYEAGASYFWFWTSDHEHHVPYPEQEALTRAFREYREKHPRDPKRLGESRRQRVCIALPYGTMLDESTLAWGALWRNDRFRLESRNDLGTTYRDLLRAAMKEAVDCLREGMDFDFAHWGDGIRLTGYREVRRVLPDGSVVRE